MGEVWARVITLKGVGGGSEMLRWAAVEKQGRVRFLANDSKHVSDDWQFGAKSGSIKIDDLGECPLIVNSGKRSVGVKGGGC